MNPKIIYYSLLTIILLAVSYWFLLGPGRSVDKEGYYLGTSTRAILVTIDKETSAGLCNQAIQIKKFVIIVRDRKDSKVKIIVETENKQTIKKTDLTLPSEITVEGINIKIEDT